MAKRHPLDGTRRNHLRGVTFVAPGWDRPDGRVRAARRLAEGFAAEGVPVTYVCTASDARPGAGPDATDRASALREVRGLVQVWRLPPLGDRLDLVELAALGLMTWDRDRMDGVYAPDPASGVVAARLGRALGVPVLIKLGRGGPDGDARAALAARDRGCRLSALRAATHVVATTPGIGREATDLLGVDPARVLVVPDGVDLEAFAPRPATPPPRRQVVVLGELAPARRVDAALEAFARVAADRDDLELVVAGDGPARAALEARAAAPGLAGKVRFTGPVDDVPALLETASVLLAPAPAEGTPMALLEGMAMEVPTLAGRTPAAEALAGDGPAPVLVPPGDPLALAEALAALLADPDRARAVGAAGRARAQAAYPLARTVLAHVEALERLKAARASGAGVLGTRGPPPLDRLALARVGASASLRAGLAAARLAGRRLLGRR